MEGIDLEKSDIRVGNEEGEFKGISISNPEQIIFPDTGITKAEVALYYRDMAELIVPFLRNRSVQLIRSIDGIHGTTQTVSVFQKSMPGELENSGSREISISDGKQLLEFVEWGALEFRISATSPQDSAHPDRLGIRIFSEQEDKEELIYCIKLFFNQFREKELDSFIKSSGGNSFEIWIPLEDGQNWSKCQRFIEKITTEVQKSFPDLSLLQNEKSSKKGKVYVFTGTKSPGWMLAPFSLISADCAPVSVPLRWEEVFENPSQSNWTMDTIRSRLASIREYPWKDFEKKQSRLP